ncbi:MAG: 6-bladed beta-propeller [Balneola sp.]|nr:6-bladed beta-propeller [Balneola sp.]
MLKLLAIILCLTFLNCAKESAEESPLIIPDSKTTQLELDPQSVANADTVELILENSFESNEQVFLDGSLSKTIIDDRDHVIIAVQRLGKLGIYVFNPNGVVEAVLGRYGRGPGEFEAIASMTISNDTLWVLDNRLQKIALYSMMDYKHIKDELLDKSLVVGEDKFTRLMKGTELFTLNKHEVLLKFEVLLFFQPNMFTKSAYYKISADGVIEPPEILNQKRYVMYIFNKGDKINRGFTAPFTRTSLFTTDQNGDMYSTWSEDFRIKKYNTKGELVKEFYYEINKSKLDLDKVKIFKERKEFIEDQGVPYTWPALNTIQADDKGRLWVSTITNSDNTFKWYVIDEDNGDLIGSFTFQGKRSDISPFVGQPFFEIKNGFFYTREFKYDQGIDRINKYKIVFKERE